MFIGKNSVVIKGLPLIAALSLVASPVLAMKPVTIQAQGSFMAGGKVIQSAGVYDGSDPNNFVGETLHGDHAYVFYQIPVKAKKYSLVFLHGYGQSGKSWETTPDGRDGFQNIFLERGYKTFIVDQPRRGRAGQSIEPYTFTARPDDQLWYNTFRIGEYPNYYANAKVPRDEESLSQFFHQMTPSFPTEQKIIVDAMIAVFEKSGEGILITHSAGGGPGWETAMRSDKVKAVISLESGAFPFLEGEVPPTEERCVDDLQETLHCSDTRYETRFQQMNLNFFLICLAYFPFRMILIKFYPCGNKLMALGSNFI
ncbi:MAG: alpha/beta fold hydrolase [Selenomonadaceae bacterium]|nr:alpha/beta fold hydrolase [Selenomonadaceae bacterium]